MIVADANVLVYLLTENTSMPKYHLFARQLFDRTPFCFPSLWKHEFHNALVTLSRSSMISIKDAQATLIGAIQFFANLECEINMPQALNIAYRYKISGYDAQYVALAEELKLPLVTEDKKLRKAVPHLTKSMEEYLHS